MAGAASQRNLEALFNVCDQNSNPLDSLDNQNEFTMGLANLFPVQENDPSCTDPLCNIEKVRWLVSCLDILIGWNKFQPCRTLFIHTHAFRSFVLLCSTRGLGRR